jgi:hypothetical protein
VRQAAGTQEQGTEEEVSHEGGHLGDGGPRHQTAGSQ